MGARQKLNGSYVVGSLVVASLVGWVTQSWIIFVVAMVVLVSVNMTNGDIRLKRRRRR